MNMDKVTYWIALGGLALGLNSEYQHGRFVALHQVAECAGSSLCRISTRAERTLAVAIGLTSRRNSPVNNLLASTQGGEMAWDRSEQSRDDAELLRDRVRDQVGEEIYAQADVIRAQTEVRRAEIERMHFRTHSQFELSGAVNRDAALICPKTSARVLVNTGRKLAEISPDVEMEDSF